MIRIQAELCSGCRQCETVCAFAHFSGAVARKMARIQVAKEEAIGLDCPVVCQQCVERYCIDACPVGALSVGSHGAVIVDQEKCVGCGQCENACPIGAVHLFEGLPLICDLCGGSPRCVETCTMDALVYEADVSDAVSLTANGDKSVDAEEKRLRYAIQQTEAQRVGMTEDEEELS